MNEDHTLNFIKAMIIEVLGLSLLFTNIDLALKFTVAIFTLSYGAWKWRNDYLDRKEKKKNETKI